LFEEESHGGVQRDEGRKVFSESMTFLERNWLGVWCCFVVFTRIRTRARLKFLNAFFNVIFYDLFTFLSHNKWENYRLYSRTYSKTTFSNKRHFRHAARSYMTRYAVKGFEKVINNVIETAVVFTNVFVYLNFLWYVRTSPFSPYSNAKRQFQRVLNHYSFV